MITYRTITFSFRDNEVVRRMSTQTLSVGRVIALLGTLAHGWPADKMLFSHKGRLYLLDRETGKVYWDTLLIIADGSDDVTAGVDERGNQTLEW